MDVAGYHEYVNSPGGKTLFRQLWEQLAFARGLRVLDFGSGFGQTASHLAQCNDVTAVEPSGEMLARRVPGRNYRQIQGSVDDLPDEQFDLVLCHNVLEFVDDRQVYLEALEARTAPGGRLSVVKHNGPGRVFRQALREGDPAGALDLLRGKLPENHFGAVGVYETGELLNWAEGHGLALEQHRGLHAFCFLCQDSAGWQDPAWAEGIFALERAAEELEAYRGAAFFHHVVLRKGQVGT